MPDLPERVLDVIRGQALLAGGQKVLVAVSGGGDSMVLLAVLARLAPAAGWRLGVAHFNHQLRGRAARLDEALVRRTADQLGLPFFTAQGQVRSRAREQGVSVEMAARDLRHAFLAATARQFGADAIALAHHADDQVETFLLRALRGAGGEGLAGMAFASPSPADPQVRLVRPLLGEPRAALRAWGSAVGVRFREDATNGGTGQPRNFLRHRIVPELRRRLQPAMAVTLPRVMTVVGEEAAFVSEAARRWLAGRRLPAFPRLHVAVQRRVVQSQLIELGMAPEFELIERLRLEAGEPTTTHGGRRVWRDDAGTVQAERMGGVVPGFDPARLAVRLVGRRGTVEFGGLRVEWRVWRGSGVAGAELERSGPGREVFDADRVGQGMELRHWQAGDRFEPIGLGRAAKVQDLFTNARVPRDERRARVLAVTAGGDVFWVEGLRVGEAVRVRPESRRLIEWRWQRRSVAGVAG